MAGLGDLDTTFGTSGRVSVHFTPYVGERGHGVGIQSDGKILLVGDSNYGEGLARYNPNGTLDVHFGVEGKLWQSTSGFPSALVMAPDDSFFVAGGAMSMAGSRWFQVRRYNRNGALDLSFGTGGGATTDMGDYAFAMDAGIQNDGKIVLVGLSQRGSERDFGLVRYNPNGSLDTTFGTGGFLTTDLGKSGDWCSAVAFQPDGKIVVAGYSENGAEDARFAVVRYTTNGVLDTTFNGSGKTTSSFGYGSEAFAVAVQSDGRILVAGWVNLQCALARYNGDGTLDKSFGTAGTGLVMKKVGTWDAWTRIGLQPDSKILAVGHSASVGRVLVARYHPDGTPDNSFGTNGAVTIALGSQLSEASALALQPNGKLLVAGTAWTLNNPYSDPALVRLENDGVAPPIVTSPESLRVDCGQPAQVTALVQNPSGLALTVNWTVNGELFQTDSLPATNALASVALSFAAELPVGTNTVAASAVDTFGNVGSSATSVTVVDRFAPSILSAKATPNILWPPNGQMVPVKVSASTRDNCDSVRLRIIGVRRSGPADNPSYPPDWKITGDETLMVRAEKDGPRSGRVYYITIQASDRSGNASETRTLTVTVPKSARKI